MQEKKPGQVAVAVLTEEERTAFATTSTAVEALEDMTRKMIRELAHNLHEKRATLMAANRAAWEAVEKKYGLDTRKSYELVQSTGEIVEHECTGHHGVAFVNLSDVLRAASEVVPAAPAEKPDPSKLN